MKKFTSWLGKIGIDGLVIVLLGVVAIGFSVYSFVGGTFVNPSLLVGVLSLLLLEVVLRRMQPNNIKEQIDSALEPRFKLLDATLQQIEGAFVETSAEKMYLELLEAFKSSKESINVISWKNSKVRFESEAGKHYAMETLRIVRETPSIAFRWLVWNTEHLESVLGLTDTINEIANYEIRFLPNSGQEEAPIMPCAIIDNNVIDFGWGYLGRPEMDQLSVKLRQPSVVNAFNEYFTYLWHKSILIKNNSEKVDQAALTKAIYESLPQQEILVQTTLADAYRQVISNYESSQESINNISWKNLKAAEEDKYFQEYLAKMLEKLKRTPTVRFRRLLWTPKHLDFLQEYASKYDDLPNVEIRYLVRTNEKDIPIIPCTTIDDKIVDFGWESLGNPQMDAVNITVRQPQAVLAFKAYFASLWQQSVVLKEREKKTDRKALVNLKRRVMQDD